MVHNAINSAHQIEIDHKSLINNLRSSVICALQPKKGGNKEIVKQEREISEAEWIPVDEFLKVGSGKIFTVYDVIISQFLNFDSSHLLQSTIRST